MENARGLGCHLAQWLAARGEHVAGVPSTATEGAILCPRPVSSPQICR